MYLLQEKVFVFDFCMYVCMYVCICVYVVDGYGGQVCPGVCGGHHQLPPEKALGEYVRGRHRRGKH